MDYFFIAAFLILTIYFTYLLIKLNQQVKTLDKNIDKILTVLGRVNKK